MKECELGFKKDIYLGKPLDKWTNYAIGSSARVFSGFVRNDRAEGQEYAIKIMRPEEPEYAKPLFREEVQILRKMKDVPGLTKLIESGFIKLNERMKLPIDEISLDDPNANAHDLQGHVERYSLSEEEEFLNMLENRIRLGWLPYLALELRCPSDGNNGNEKNFYQLFDLAYTKGHPKSVIGGLEMAIQICNIIEQAHQRNIWYRDHKIVHYYWNNRQKKVYAIDWNISKLEAKKLSEYQKRFDLVQFGAGVLYHMFTGREFNRGLKLGPTKAQDLEKEPLGYKLVQWKYDDEQRTTKELRNILEGVINGQYCDAGVLRKDLQGCMDQTEQLDLEAHDLA